MSKLPIVLQTKSGEHLQDHWVSGLPFLAYSSEEFSHCQVFVTSGAFTFTNVFGKGTHLNRNQGKANKLEMSFNTSVATQTLNYLFL